MEEIRLYDINSIEFSELIDAARVELKNNNPEYKELCVEFGKKYILPFSVSSEVE